MQFPRNSQTNEACAALESLAYARLIHDSATLLTLPIPLYCQVYPASSTGFWIPLADISAITHENTEISHKIAVDAALQFVRRTTRHEPRYRAGTKRSVILPCVIVISSSRTFLSSPLKIGSKGSLFSNDAAIFVRASSVSTRTVASRC